MVGKGDLQIFLAHASEDKETVRALYWRLKGSGYKPWLDEEDILPGQQWQQEIPKAIRNSGIFLACYSKHAVFKESYIQKEFRYALMELANKPPGTIYFVPLRLEDCMIPPLEIPDLGLKLTDFQWLDFWKENSFAKLEKTFQLRLAQLAKATSQQLAKPEKPVIAATKSIAEKAKIVNAYEIFEKAFKLQELGRNEDAIVSYDRALKIKPDYHEAWNNRGVSLNSLGRNEDAIVSYDRAQEIKPDEAWNNRGNALGSLGRYEEAIASYDRALEIKPDDHEAWSNRGVALGNLGRHEEAFASYDRALAIKPDFHEAWNNRGVALGNLGKYEDESACYDRVLEIQPDNPCALFNKACCYGLQKDVEAAVKNLRRAIDLDATYQEMAKADSYFDNIRETPPFKSLIYEE